MSSVLNSIFGKKRQRPSYLTTMFCLDCGNLYQTSCITSPCRRCGSGSSIAAARWAPAKYGMPRLERTGDIGGGYER